MEVTVHLIEPRKATEFAKANKTAIRGTSQAGLILFFVPTKTQK